MWSGVLAKSAAGDRILVVMEDETQRGDYSQLWKDLESMHALAEWHKLVTDHPDSERLQSHL